MKTASEISHEIGGIEGTDIRAQVMELCEIVQRLETKLKRIEKRIEGTAIKAANDASCLANGIIIPD